MTDTKELLELAARAAGYDVEMEYYGPDRHGLKRNGDAPAIWNPLEDDGDALRLVIAVGMLVDARYTNPESIKYNRVLYWLEPSGAKCVTFDGEGDCGKQARLAIVRAAAEIGRKMKEDNQ